VSVPFDFTAPWLPDYDGARVRCYFDPADPKCAATVCLAAPWNGRASGTVLGTAQQINDLAGYTRMVMGWGDDPSTAGVQARQAAAASVRREVRATVGKGRGASCSEERDGLGSVMRVESASNEIEHEKDATESAVPTRVAPLAGPERVGQRSGSRAVTPELDAERLARAEDFERDHALEFV
jgi:hypothetical protein